eukprot:TRINITY_DN19936_c0_g4_i1.p1 TRINITY_DN19936_c0_g4~~TRINITY_DN19936_c0_g4_i1.p1  ORF type:complete len:121 (-),score=16.79 TRINITY_DN19936_c0_g4_i1:880-1242(-)
MRSGMKGFFFSIFTGKFQDSVFEGSRSTITAPMNFRSRVLQGLDLQASVDTLFALCGRLLFRAALCRKSSRLSLLPFVQIQALNALHPGLGFYQGLLYRLDLQISVFSCIFVNSLRSSPL